MNAKLCKQARRLAKARTVDKPARDLVVLQSGTKSLPGADGEEPLLVPRYQFFNHPESTRGVYRRFKRILRNPTAPALPRLLKEGGY